MDKQKNLQKVLLPILAVCFAAALAVMIFALNRPQEKAEFTPPPFEAPPSRARPTFPKIWGTARRTKRA